MRRVSFPATADEDLSIVETEPHRHDPAGDSAAQIMRDMLDQLYDGQHAGRWSLDQLRKTEKAHGARAD